MDEFVKAFSRCADFATSTIAFESRACVQQLQGSGKWRKCYPTFPRFAGFFKLLSIPRIFLLRVFPKLPSTQVFASLNYTKKSSKLPFFVRYTYTLCFCATFGSSHELNCFSFNFLTLHWPVQIVLFVFIYSINGVNEHKKGSES
jgi:hypothetical protein